MQKEEATMEVGKEFSDRYFKSLPPGIRFRPTDLELVDYLRKKVLKEKMPLHRIKTCNIYRYHPNDICGLDDVAREKERYFFTTTVKKYPKGGRPDRKAGDGFWKATGRDLPIICKGKEVGFKKTLVYYEGKHRDISNHKTNWIMHEYRIRRDILPVAKDQGDNNNKNDNNILDECVLVKIYEKTSSKKPAETTSPSQDDSQQIMDSEQQPPQEQENPILEPTAAEQVAQPPQYPYHQNPMPEATAAAAYNGYNTNMVTLQGSKQLPLPPPEAQDNPILEPEKYPTAEQVAAPPQYPNHQNPMARATATAAAAYHGYNTYMMIPESEQLPLPPLEAQDNPTLEPIQYQMAPQVAELPPFPYQENPMDETAAATFYGWDVGNFGFENCFGINNGGAFSFQEDNGFWGSQNGGLEDVVGMYIGNNVNPSSSAKPHGPAIVGDNVNPLPTRHGPVNVSHKQKRNKKKNDV